jgi:hypothetical protein
MGVRLKKTSINPSESDAGHDTVKKSSNACCGTNWAHILMGPSGAGMMMCEDPLKLLILRDRDHGIIVNSPLIPV